MITRARSEVRMDNGVWKRRTERVTITCRSHTPTWLKAEGVTTSAWAEVARIEKELGCLMRSQGCRTVTIEQRVTRVERDPRLQYSNDEVDARLALQPLSVY